MRIPRSEWTPFITSGQEEIMGEKAREALEEIEEKHLADLQADAESEREDEITAESIDPVNTDEEVFEIKSSGEANEEFETGAVRDTDGGKPRPDLIHPYFLRRVGQHLGDAARPIEKGGKGYDEWNWSKGIPIARSYASLCRHVMEYAEGDRSEDHLAAAVCNVMFIMCTEELVKRKLLPINLLNMQDWKGEE